MLFKTKLFVLLSVLVLFGSLFSASSLASIGLYVGKNLTEDGSVLLGGYGDEPSSHWIEVIPRKEHDPDATITVGVTEDARYSGELFEIPQAEETFKYITVRYSSFAGFPPPLENGGLNEYGVAGRDIWSPSRNELREMTPDGHKGLNYSDEAGIAMQRATTAREAAAIVGEMVDEYNHATYGGNSHFFADSEEGWVVIQFAGNQNLWVAERVGPDDIRVSFPGYIGEIPLDYEDHPDYMGSPNLISFAEEQGWFDPEEDEVFNVNKVYGTDRDSDQEGHQMRSPLNVEMEEFLEERVPVSLEDMMEAVRSTIVTSQTAGYGTVAHLRPDTPRELQTLWATVAPSLTSPFVPYYIGMTEVPPEFHWGRYMSANESSSFMPPELNAQEGTQYAYRVFKRLFYSVDAPRWRAEKHWPDHKDDFEYWTGSDTYGTSERWDKFYPEVYETMVAYEDSMIADRDSKVEPTVQALLDADQLELAKKYLTDYSNARSMQSLDIVNALTESIVMRSKLLFGIDTYLSDEIYDEFR